MYSFPKGTVTFLFTDIEGSTKLWEQHPEEMQEALRKHDELLNKGFASYEGMVVKSRGEGDSFFAVFPNAADAVRAAYAVQRSLAGAVWPLPQRLAVRMALHTGDAEFRNGDYYGPAVNRCARLRATAHGGQVILSAVTAQLVRESLPGGTTLRDLGMHRLKDLAAPEQVSQLVHQDLPDNFPPLKSLNAHLHNLPIQTTRFIGRERELAQLQTLMIQTRLLTLLGPGGAGKTRLSLQLAADSLEEFADGVWLIELAPFSEPHLVTQSVAATFGVKEKDGGALSDVLADYLRPKQLLLVLDNCEHLIEACAALAASLLKTCPEVRILATSREPLNITGESIWRVPSLSFPDLSNLPPVESLTMYEAVRLFIDRAVSAQHTFTATSQNTPAIAQICFRLDGIPLALELAAARVKSLSVEQIARRLDDSFRLLNGGDRTRLPRQQTLRALVDWSHDLLSKPERILWRRMAIFAGNFTLEAVEAVCSGDGVEEFEVLDLLVQLVDKSLVVSEERDGESRYRLLETMRQYGGEKLAQADEREVVLARHCDHYLKVVEQTAAGLRSPHMQAAHISVWVREIDNLRIAMDWSQERAVTDSGILDKAGRLISASQWLWPMSGLTREGYDRLRAWIALPSETALTKTRVNALNVAAFLSGILKTESSFKYVQESLEIASKLGDRPSIARSQSILALGTLVTGQYQKAIDLFDSVLAMLRELNLDWEITQQMRFKTAALLFNEDIAGALHTAEENLKLCRELGNTHDEAASLRQLGILALMRRDYSESRSYFWKSHAITRNLGDKQCTTEGFAGITLLAESLGQYGFAAWLGGAYWAISEAIGFGGVSIVGPQAPEKLAELHDAYPDDWTAGQGTTFEEAARRVEAFLCEEIW